MSGSTPQSGLKGRILSGIKPTSERKARDQRIGGRL